MLEYKHGGDVQGFAKDVGCDISEVVDLSSNINFIKPNIDIDFNNIDISSYPNYEKLYQNIATLYDIKEDEIELYNGASSGIFSLFRNLNHLKSCYIYSPAYLEYKKAANSFGYSVELINRYIDINRYIFQNSLVIFVNPSTPDGNFYDMDKLMKKWISKNCTIIVDESFLDFCSDSSFKSVTPYIKTYDKLYIIKSMTKFYSSAGIRIGAVISSKENIKNLKDKEPAWKISQFDSHYIVEALKDTNFLKVSKAININNKEYLTHILNSSKYIKTVFPSVANYCMVQLQKIKAKEFQELLKPYKIMIRDCSNFDFLDDDFIRVAVKDQNSLEELKSAIARLN